MTPDATLSRAGRSFKHHLLARHRIVAKEPRQPHLTGTIAVRPANPNPAPAALDETSQKKGPLFSRRRSPKCPRHIDIQTSNNKTNQIQKA